MILYEWWWNTTTSTIRYHKIWFTAVWWNFSGLGTLFNMHPLAELLQNVSNISSTYIQRLPKTDMWCWLQVHPDQPIRWTPPPPKDRCKPDFQAEHHRQYLANQNHLVDPSELFHHIGGTPHICKTVIMIGQTRIQIVEGNRINSLRRRLPNSSNFMT